MRIMAGMLHETDIGFALIWVFKKIWFIIGNAYKCLYFGIRFECEALFEDQFLIGFAEWIHLEYPAKATRVMQIKMDKEKLHVSRLEYEWIYFQPLFPNMQSSVGLIHFEILTGKNSGF